MTCLFEQTTHLSFQHYIYITLDNRTSICQQLIYPMCALWLRCLHWHWHHYRYTGAALHTCLLTAAGGPVMWPLESCTTATPPPAPPAPWQVKQAAADTRCRRHSPEQQRSTGHFPGPWTWILPLRDNCGVQASYS